ncbi:MAG: hypothetical protein CR967_00840 [Proteobacteria bacterium]|nr:MAG: hypothetical protein CR967_00840 [Pseudomonadota bacterium]
MRVLIDTNIFLDLILKRKYSQEALLILNAVEKDILKGVILDITILNIDYVAKVQVKDIRDFLLLINSTFQIVSLSNEEIKQALNMKNNDLEDNFQYICAKKLKCDTIITNDKTFYSKDLEKMTSYEFVKNILS